MAKLIYYIINLLIILIFYILKKMLDIIKSKLKNTYKKKSLNNSNVTIRNKDFVPAVRD